MRIDLEKTHHFCSIGTFVFTVLILAATVWPLFQSHANANPLRQAISSSANGANEQPKQGPLVSWVMPSVLAGALLLAAFLHLAAARVSRSKGQLGSALPDTRIDQHLEMHAMHERIDQLRGTRSPLEAATFDQIKRQWAQLPFPQKIALKMVCSNVEMTNVALKAEMESWGFGEKVEVSVIEPFRHSNLVEFGSDGIVRPHPGRLKDIEEIVFSWNPIF